MRPIPATCRRPMPGKCARRLSARIATQSWRRSAGCSTLPRIRCRTEARRALVGRAASLIAPDSALTADAPELIAAMLAAGYDRAAARWIGAVRQMDGDTADRSWAMLALAAPDPRGLDLSSGRISRFIGRDKSPGKVRSSLFVAGLAGLGRIDSSIANSLNRRYRTGHGSAVELDPDGRRRRRARPGRDSPRLDGNRLTDAEL